MDKEIAEEIIRENRYPSGYDIQDYLFDNEDTVLSLEDGTELLDDFDLWKERSDLELEKIMRTITHSLFRQLCPCWLRQP